MADGVRIQKALADAGIASRRAAEQLVSQGRVTVNGVPAQIGQRVEPGVDQIAVNGRLVAGRPATVYLAMFKPAGVTSTVSDRHAERTVVSLVPEDMLRAAGRVYPVGRLDRDSEGLLLLTNDGEWAQRMLHPRYRIEREYAVGLSESLTIDQARALESGVELEEGMGRLEGLRPATTSEIVRLEALAGRSPVRLYWYRAVLTQGWRRQIRRMLTAVGIPVQRLIRVRVGTLRVDGLAPGEVRMLTAAERNRLDTLAQSGHRRAEPLRPSAKGQAAPNGRARPRRKGLVVSLDGPASSGKSTVGARAALELGYRFCDTGLLYRALAWLSAERSIDPEDSVALVALVPEMRLVADEAGRLRRVHVGGRDVTDQLHSGAVEGRVSVVSRHPQVRAALLPVQRAIAAEGRIIMAGRDIGTVVLPDADVKLYLEVSVAERARRRAEERGLAPETPESREIEAELRRRDTLDSTRATAPLRIPEGAVVIRTDENRIEDTVAEVVSVIREAQKRSRADGSGKES
jgi:cytidylate kinase